MAKATTPRKPIFIPGAFDDLRAAAGQEAGNAPLRVRLVDIDEDPDQPRTTFDPGELQQLADTITLLGGVLQPIGLRAPAEGRYRLVFGARRYRASKLLGLADIPAIIVADDQAGLTAQVIENQSRANLSNSDLAAVIVRLTEQGMKGKQIATVCGLTDHAVTMFRSAPRLPPLLAARMDDGDMRALYELFTAWQKQPAEIEAALAGHEAALSVTEARRLIEAATGRATSSIYLRGKASAASETVDVAQEGEPALARLELPHSGEAVASPPASKPPHSGEAALAVPAKVAAGEVDRTPLPPGSAKARKSEPVTGPSHPASLPVPVFIMETSEGRRGFLVTNQGTGTMGDGGTVLLDVEGEKVEVSFVSLRPVAVG